MPDILGLPGSDYFLSPHAGCAGELINYAAEHNNWSIPHAASARVKADKVKFDLYTVGPRVEYTGY